LATDAIHKRGFAKRGLPAEQVLKEQADKPKTIARIALGAFDK